MNDRRWTNKIWEWIPLEDRKRDKSKNTWIKGFHEAMVTRELKKEKWKDRSEWSK